MKNLFQILPSDFFKPLTSKYRQVYADCILLIFNTFKPEISYGVNREIVVKALTEYFDPNGFVRGYQENACEFCFTNEQMQKIQLELEKSGLEINAEE